MESTLVVAENVEGKFGPQVKDTNGEYYSFGKFYKGSKTFAQGSQLKVELYVSEKNNKYINKVLESIKQEPKAASLEPLSKPIVKRGRPSKSNGNGSLVSTVSNTVKTPEYKPRDYDKEARGKTRCAAMTAVLSPMLPILVTNPQNMEEVKEKARELANFVVSYSFGEDE